MKQAVKGILLMFGCALALVLGRYAWSTIPGRYQVAGLGDGLSLQVNTATGEKWIVQIHGVDHDPRGDAFDTSVMVYSEPLSALRRLNITGRPE
jgi:hypothetical protein